ncbi:MAG TPA: hypothetical protein VIM11_26665 [Tepidisphaeraceae bacterium]|jgi:hypothetical protein
MASFEFPLGKLEIINSALSQTGDNLVAVADDGSVEWSACSPAYERALAFVCEDHPWSWLTDVRTLVPSPTKPDDDQFDTAYPLPADLVHLIMVRLNDVPCVWDIFNNQIVVNAQGGPPPPNPPTTPLPVTIKGIFSTNSDPTFATPTVVLVLQLAVMSGIYRGLKRDYAEAGSLWKQATAMLDHAKARHDMQKPKTAIFNSRYTAIRRSRKPWRQTPYGWSGTGTPN